MSKPPWIWYPALILGIAAGLVFAWILAPDRQPGTPPRSLRADYKDQFRETIAASYAVTGDLARARARLQLLGDADSIEALSAQAQRLLAAGLPFETAQELARLASDLQAGVSSLPSRSAAPVSGAAPSPPPPRATPANAPPSTVTRGPSVAASQGDAATAFPTPSPFSSPTPMPSPSAPFRLVSRDEFCDPLAHAGILQITILDAKGGPLPGIELTITWDQGADRFFTGLQPEISPGYADYTMKGGKMYSLQVARLGVPVSGLTPPICTPASAQPYLGGLQLTFRAP